MQYPKHLFFTYGSYESQWWTVKDHVLREGQTKCTPEERAGVLEFSLAALHFPSLPFDGQKAVRSQLIDL